MLNDYCTEIESGDGNIHNFSVDKISETATNDSTATTYLLNSKETIFKTEIKVESTGNRFSLSSEGDIVKDEEPSAGMDSPRKAVNAVVTAIYEDSIHCRILLDEDTFEIQLPSVLAPENVYWGMPVSIELDRTSGYVTPVIKAREVPDVEHEEMAAIDKLIDSL